MACQQRGGRTSSGLIDESFCTRLLSNAAGFFSMSFCLTAFSSSSCSLLLWQSSHEHSSMSHNTPALKHSQ
eukprot:COSAG06_NODE_42_length_29897_cov_42.547721_5_plen_71_part_00